MRKHWQDTHLSDKCPCSKILQGLLGDTPKTLFVPAENFPDKEKYKQKEKSGI